ncbi:MAG: hypothetical protein QGD89_05820 [Actinomycetota bacterium]|nr:hypothetical protein [Actinomycetota bacterium]
MSPLNTSELSGDSGKPAPFRVLDTSNRRSAAIVYLVVAAFTGVLVVTTDITPLWATAVLPLVLLAAYHFLTGRRMRISDMEAIRIGSATAPFEVGHGSATLGFAGMLAKPVWQVLVFEAGATPLHQALVTVDALSGEVQGIYTQSVPPL